LLNKKENKKMRHGKLTNSGQFEQRGRDIYYRSHNEQKLKHFAVVVDGEIKLRHNATEMQEKIYKVFIEKPCYQKAREKAIEGAKNEN